MDDEFEYEGLLVQYVVETGDYMLRSINYDYYVGIVFVKEGPGAIIEMEEYRDWMDWSTCQAVANFLSDLNETIKE